LILVGPQTEQIPVLACSSISERLCVITIWGTRNHH